MLDPRTHLVLALAFGGLVVFSRDLGWLAGEWLALALTLVVLRQTVSYLRWLLMLLPMAVFFGGVTWWTADLTAGATAALALLTLTTVFFLFFTSTDPEDLGNALVRTGLPYPVVFVITAGLQFVPVIARKARQVFDAQRARGIELRPGWRTLRRYPAFLTPLLIQVFQMADGLAEAMECRGFGRTGRSFLKRYRMGPRDWTAIVFGLALVAGCLYIRYR
jgi:energy-coupling factor transport system permease protein